MSKPLLLLIDDSGEMGLIVASLGRRAGWETAVRVDADGGWQALAERRPELVLLDVNLPGASGLDWLRRVRAAPEHANLVVALYTHWGLPADVAAGLNAGVDFVFDKDLAARPTDWQRRLLEIGEFGRSGKCAGVWPKTDRPCMMKSGERPMPATEAWTDAFNQALRHPLLRRLTGEVLPAVLRRALTKALGSAMLPPALDDWIGPEGFDSERVPPILAPASPVIMAVCLAEQIERLLGEEAGTAFRNALTSVPGFRECLSAP